MRPLLIATRNKGKLEEMRNLLQDLPFAIRGIADIPGMEDFEVEETGDTFEQNAAMKARGYGEKAKMLTIADDSGLEVDVLHGEPGVRSARYVPGTDWDRMMALLQKMEKVQDGARGAQFYSAVALYDPTTEKITLTNGICRGRITHEPAGEQGFGYDPIFYAEKLGATFGQKSMEEKQSVDHRAKAMTKMKEILLKEYV